MKMMHNNTDWVLMGIRRSTDGTGLNALGFWGDNMGFAAGLLLMTLMTTSSIAALDGGLRATNYLAHSHTLSHTHART